MTRAAVQSVDIGEDEPWPKVGRVYVVINTVRDTAKIGYSTDMWKRFADLKTSSADPLILPHWFKADRTVERRIHYHLREQRLSGEWFKWNEATQTLVDELEDFVEQWDEHDGLDVDGRDYYTLTAADVDRIVADPSYGIDPTADDGGDDEPA